MENKKNFITKMVNKAQLKDPERKKHNVGGVNLFRHSFVSEKLALAKDTKDRLHLARLMRHGVVMSTAYVNDIPTQKKRDASISEASRKLIDDTNTQEEEIFEIPTTTRFSERLKNVAHPTKHNKPTRKPAKNSKRKK